MTTTGERAEQIIADVLARPTMNGYPSDILNDLGSAGLTVVETWTTEDHAHATTPSDRDRGRELAELAETLSTISLDPADQGPALNALSLRLRTLAAPAETEAGDGDPGAYWSPSRRAFYREHDDGHGGLVWLNVEDRRDAGLPSDARRVTLAATPQDQR